MLEVTAIFEDAKRNFSHRSISSLRVLNFIAQLFGCCAANQTRGGLKWLCFRSVSCATSTTTASSTAIKSPSTPNELRLPFPRTMDTGNMCCEVVTSHVDPFCDFSSTTSAVATPDAAPEPMPSPFAVPHMTPKEDEDKSPLYTEINIPLPTMALPSTKPHQAQQSLSPPPKSRSRAVSLSSLSPFRRRSSSIGSSGRASEEWPRIKKEVKNREVAAAMNLNHQSKRGRSGTIDALAVVPAVLVLSAELFTPGQSSPGRRNGSGVGRWEDGIR